MENSGKRGKISSGCEVANISPFGVWVLVEDHEYFLNHKQYPWFKGASVEEVLDIESPRTGHLRWPSLDIDLHIDSLKNPERYPLTAKQASQRKRTPLKRKARGEH
jgi:hypothetical protein